VKRFTVNDATLLRLRRQLKRHEITHDRIAAELKIGRTAVVHGLRGRSMRVIDAARRLISEAKEKPAVGAA
jgi:hypothetical protein